MLMKLQRWAGEPKSVWQKSTHGIRSADSMKMYSQSKRGKIYENLDIL